MENQITTIFSDTEFLKRALTLSPEELQKVLKDEKGVDASLDEIVEAGKVVNTFISRGDELSTEDLEMVAGGGKVLQFVGGVATGVAIVGVSFLVGVGIAAVSW